MTTSFEEAAIIGYFRSGAELWVIAKIINISVDEVFWVIINYFED